MRLFHAIPEIYRLWCERRGDPFFITTAHTSVPYFLFENKLFYDYFLSSAGDHSYLQNLFVLLFQYICNKVGCYYQNNRHQCLCFFYSSSTIHTLVFLHCILYPLPQPPYTQTPPISKMHIILPTLVVRTLVYVLYFCHIYTPRINVFICKFI